MRRKRKTNSKKILLLIAFLIVVFLLYFFSDKIKTIAKPAKVEPPISEERSISTQPISFEQKSRSDELQKFTYDIKYPYFNIDFVDQDIKKTIDGKFQTFEKDAIVNEIFGDYKFDFTVTFEDYLVSDEVVSIKFIASSFLGGAHGIHDVITKNYDLKQKQEIQLEDMFDSKGYLKYVSDKAIAQLLAQKVSDESWIKTGAAASKENFKNFNISKDGETIIFHFSHYQVAPYYLGIIPFEVDIEELKPFLKN